jgi:hypothetical protein
MDGKDGRMVAWAQIAKDAPEFAARVRGRFQMGTNKTLATLRRDGSPRISAIEAGFTASNVTMGMMGGSLKLLGGPRLNSRRAYPGSGSPAFSASTYLTPIC